MKQPDPKNSLARKKAKQRNQVTSNIPSNRKFRSRNDPQTGIDFKRKSSVPIQLPTQPTVFAKSGGGDMLPYYSPSDVAGIKKAKAKK
jgi:hypothetical protein